MPVRPSAWPGSTPDTAPGAARRLRPSGGDVAMPAPAPRMQRQRPAAEDGRKREPGCARESPCGGGMGLPSVARMNQPRLRVVVVPETVPPAAVPQPGAAGKDTTPAQLLSPEQSVWTTIRNVGSRADRSRLLTPALSALSASGYRSGRCRAGSLNGRQAREAGAAATTLGLARPVEQRPRPAVLHFRGRRARYRSPSLF
jgi:hypothetical protein